MGDIRRNEEFAKFIFRNFPAKKYRRVLVVADGKGELSKLLSKKYLVRVIENKPRQVSRRKRVNYQKGWFEGSSEVREDFIVGMHPDDATAPIIIAAERNKIGWAVVPCCLRGIHAHDIKGFLNWINKLKSLSKYKNIHINKLEISGKNTVLWSLR